MKNTMLVLIGAMFGASAALVYAATTMQPIVADLEKCLNG